MHPGIDILQYFDFKDGKRPWDKLIERIKKVKNSTPKLNVTDLTVEELENLIRSASIWHKKLPTLKAGKYKQMK